MRGCWWPCMESTPRKGKTFLNRARATSSISCSKVRWTIWDDLIAPCRQWGAAGAVHQQWGAEVLQQGEEEQEEESRDRICRVRAGGGLPQNWIKPASGLFEFELTWCLVSTSIYIKKLTHLNPGTETPAAIGDASGNRGQARWHFLCQSQHWVCGGRLVKVIKSNQGNGLNCVGNFSVSRDCCCTPPAPTMRSTRTVLTLAGGGWSGLRIPGESKTQIKHDLKWNCTLPHTWIQVQRKRPKACRVLGDKIKRRSIENLKGSGSIQRRIRKEQIFVQDMC